MNNRVAVLFIVAFNLAPVAGALYFGWRPFEAFWFFWLETLIMTVFNSIRIVFSQHGEAGGARPRAAMVYHTGKALTYLLVRIGIFFFYSIFIITFIGFAPNTNGNKADVLNTLLFQNRFFNLGLLISIAAQGYYLLFYFFRSGAYHTADPGRYAALFDSRQLIIHIAVLLGTFGSSFLVKSTSFGRYSGVLIIGIFCILKTAAELFNHEYIREETAK